MHKVKINLNVETIAKVVQCIADAVGDDIREDIRRNDLQTNNGTPSRIWDYMNRNLIKRLGAEDCTTIKCNRGPWEMVIVYENTSQCIFTFMREKRFAELQKQQCKRRKMHYLDMLTKQFNSDLLSSQEQFEFVPHVFQDEGLLKEKVQLLLQDLEGGVDVVRNHVLVLFETAGFQLTRIRAVMITPSLDIVEGSEQDWSQYIVAQESAVVDEVLEPHSPSNRPDLNLDFTAKAHQRMKTVLEHKATENVELEEN